MVANYSATLPLSLDRDAAMRVLLSALLVPALLLVAACDRPETYKSVPSSALLAPAPQPRPQVLENKAPPEELVREAQGLLAELGYRPGPNDGIVGRWTETAIRAFQETRGIEPDGLVTEDLIAELEKVKKTAFVRDAQEQLARLGYNPGPADGDMGPKTQRAIAAFEADAGVTPRGQATPELLRLLARAAGPVPEQTAGADTTAAAVEDDATVPAAVETATETVSDVEPAPVAAVSSAEPVVAVSASSAAAEDELQDMRVESLLTSHDEPGAIGRAELETTDLGAAALNDAGQLAPAAGMPSTAEDSAANGLPRAGQVSLVSEDSSSDAVTQMAKSDVAASETSASEAAAEPRIIAPGDRIRLQIVSDKIEVREFQVDDAGRIQLEDTIEVQAAGRTLYELEQAVMVQLVQVYLMSLEVNISHPADPVVSATGDDQLQ